MSPRPPAWFRVGTLTPVLALTVAGTAVTLAALASYGVFPARRAAMLEGPTARELEATLMRVGLSAETLTAAGCSDVDATNGGADAKSHLDQARWTSLQNADQEVRDAQADVDRLGRLVRAGQASRQDLTAYSTAKAALASAQTARDGLLDALFDAAVADLDAGEITLLEIMHGNGGRPAPLQYRVTGRSDADWTDLRDAIANLKTSAKCGEEPDDSCVQLVASIDAEPDVAAAAFNLDSNLDAVSTAFAAALGHE